MTDQIKARITIHALPILLILEALTGWTAFYYLGAAFVVFCFGVIGLLGVLVYSPLAKKIKFTTPEFPKKTVWDKISMWAYRLTYLFVIATLYIQGRYFTATVMIASFALLKLYAVRVRKLKASA